VALSDVQRREGIGVQLRQREPRTAMPEARGSGAAGKLADDAFDGRDQGRPFGERIGAGDRAPARGGSGPSDHGAVGGFWSGAEWLACRDGKARPVEPGSFPLAHGAPARVGRLRAYGNAIVAEAAATFIRAAMTG
jgi:DNA (cytosine-5)-methyltransferase 1